ncbi:endonuclease [Alteromonas sp. D210916BOD_24]|uniref:endonuclease n=1 Tax=Alteromonas sp. D210916BOD_24 TaxID=3157618 RepID=UPI00399D3B68
MQLNLRHVMGVAGVLLPAIAMGQVANGDFETWTSGSPDAWTSIDTGISVAENTAYSFSGNSSAAITVNTGTQGSTDFRQSVSVTAGENYEFSVRVYHTEGAVKARLYVDGYQGYSDNTVTGSWQQITYSYTASSSTEIEVGLRFYDQTGFDGSEIVYVDLFEPTTASSGGGTGNGSSCSTYSGTLNLTTDNYGSETSWEITNANNQVEASGGNYASNQSYSESVCLSEGDFTFTINDTYGDGICCSYGSGSYSLVMDGVTVSSGGTFSASESTSFTLGSTGGGDTGGGGSTPDLSGYYASADGLTGYSLKTALYNIINNHSTQSYGDLWTFYISYSSDSYYENDGSILDMYSENPSTSDAYNFTAGSDQCGSYSGEGDCYNREHAFPRSWFGGAVSPMNTDVHHIFATDGYVNGRRSSYPYGEVGSATYTSSNGSKLGSGTSASGYTGTVFEPIDEFKGDFARAYFYMATRYENVIANWENNSTYGDVVLNGTNDQVFENWFLTLLLNWHIQDPVSQKEIDRNDAAYSFQNNRNPFIDHPELVTEIWGN